MLRQGRVELLLIRAGDLGDLGDRVGQTDLGLRPILVCAVEAVGRDVLRGCRDVEAIDAVGQHDAVAVNDVAAHAVGGHGLQLPQIGGPGELLGLHQLDVHQADDEHRHDREHRDDRQRESPVRHAHGGHR